MEVRNLGDVASGSGVPDFGVEKAALAPKHLQRVRSQRPQKTAT